MGPKTKETATASAKKSNVTKEQTKVVTKDRKEKVQATALKAKQRVTRYTICSSLTDSFIASI